MLSSFIEPLVLLVSSLVSLSIVYYRVPDSTLQQIVAVLLVVLLITLNRFILARHRVISYNWSLILLFVIATFVQLLILSTGGFYSPFLILFHLFAISIGFLLRSRAAISFLIFAVGALMINTLVLDQKLHTLFINDPWAAILYLLSFVAIIPVYQLVVSRYNLKDALSNMLSTQLKLTDTELKLTKKRQESLLGGLSDIVIVTNIHLHILSFNEATTQALHLSASELLERPLLDILYLKGSNGEMFDASSLSLEKALKEGLSSVVNDLLLYTKNSSFPKQVDVRIRPTTNLEGHVDQIVFIISGISIRSDEHTIYRSIEPSLLRQESALEELKNNLKERGLLDLKARVELLGKQEHDILTILEIEDHGIRPNPALVDVSELVRRIVAGEQDFAGNFGTQLQVVFDEQFTSKFTVINLKTAGEIPVMMTAPFFTVPIDPKWLDILLGKLITIAILIGSKEKNRTIKLLLTYTDEAVVVVISTVCRLPAANYQEALLTRYYGVLANQTNLSLGSGLEGYIARMVSTLLNIPLSVNYQEEASSLSFTLKLSKQPTS